jgi:hypothetical protein
MRQCNGNAMQCIAMQCNAMQCNAMQCNAMQCNAMQCNAIMQRNAMQYILKSSLFITHQPHFPELTFFTFLEFLQLSNFNVQPFEYVFPSEPQIGSYCAVHLKLHSRKIHLKATVSVISATACQPVISGYLKKGLSCVIVITFISFLFSYL